jgi:hypothetical protein
MSQQLATVVIVMSRCSRSREMFGMRFEQLAPDPWGVDWAFPVRESAAKKEGYDQNDIKGTFAFDDEYPGCPYCHSPGAIYCGRCNKVSCHDQQGSVARCGWCGFSGPVGSGGVGGLKAGGDV